MRQQAVWAAVVTCAEVLGKAATKPVVLQDTNNVVVHLAPCPVVAKVGRFPWSAEVLAKEVRVARHLADVGAPVAAPLGDLVIEPGTDLPVSLWERLVRSGDAPAPVEAATALAAVHDGLRTYPDPALLDLMGRLGSARVATWCWASDHPEMRAHGEHHLELVRAAWTA